MALNVLFEGSNFERLLGGLWVTAKIAFVSVFFACVLGVILGLLMTNKNRVIRALCRFLFGICPHYSFVGLTFYNLFWCGKMVQHAH